jgi:prepilin-type N-terminal cleavage/methylation domain-containing protein
MKKKGFTLIELLVVIAIIAMLLAILMPALNKVKKIAMRVICGTNLKGLGTAQTVYANDYNGEYALQGGKTNPTWSTDGATNYWAMATVPWSDSTQGPEVTIGASLYLLVREADVAPKSFICPAGSEKEFDGKNPSMLDITQLWDFGGDPVATYGSPVTAVSYSYHQPYRGGDTTPTGNNGKKSRYAAGDTRSASFAMMADKNPWFDAKLSLNASATQSDFTSFRAPLNLGVVPAGTPTDWNSIDKWKVGVANAQPHDRDGQNVTYADGHNSYETRSDVGTKNDNIYTTWESSTPGNIEKAWRIGTLLGTPQGNFPRSLDDSFLVNDKLSAQTFP